MNASSAPGGTLSVNFTTAFMQGTFDKVPDSHVNYGAVWIEDSMGRYVRGLEHWAVKYPLSLKVFVAHQGLVCSDAADVVTKPTLTVHGPHQATWNGTDRSNHVVPDGTYKLWVEVQIDEIHPQAALSIDIVKGREPWMNSVPQMGAVQSLTLMYTPTPLK